MKIGIIIGTVRQGRHTEKLAKWALKEANDLEGVDAELLDLADYDLPFFAEPVSPKYNPKRELSGVVKKWLDKIAEKDAYIVVTPEYNHSIPGVLKNALDYTDFQVARKPFSLITHGTAGGARAAAHLKDILSEIRGMVISTNVALTMRTSEVFDENGTLSEEIAAQEYGPLASLHSSLDELLWYA